MKTIFLLLPAIALRVPAEAKPKVAILNVQKAILSTEEGKTAAAALTRKFAPKEARLSKEQREIENLESQLHGGAVRTDDEAASLKARIATLAGNNRRALEDARQEIDVEQKRILNELAAKLLLVVEKYAKKKHFEVVLDEGDPRTPIYWRAEKTDITDEVVKRYDQAVKKH
jgi:outer membrane protein